MKIGIINHQAVSLYADQGWSLKRLAEYYNPCNVADKVVIFAYMDKDWEISEKIKIIGFETTNKILIGMKEFDPDIIRCYECNEPFASIALQISEFLHKPSYLSLHDSRKLQTMEHNLRRYTVITGYNEHVTDVSASWLDRLVEIQKNGIDSSKFKYTPSSIVAPTDAFKIYTIGRDDPVKNLEAMIQATDMFANVCNIKVQHIISGPGIELQTELHTGIGETTENDIIKYMSWCDVFMQIQLVPDIGMALTEALMIGKPSITGGDANTTAALSFDHFGEQVMAARVIPLYLATSKENIVNVLIEFLERKENGTLPLYSPVVRQWTIDNYDASMWRKKEAERYGKVVANWQKKAA